VLVDPGHSGLDEVLDPEVVGGPEDAYGFDDPADEVRVKEPVGTEARKPCPVCGEMIVATASKCRFCGEILDKTMRGKADPQTLRAFRKNIHGLGGAWIFFGLVCVLMGVGAQALGENRNVDTGALAAGYFISALIWFVAAIFAFLKHMWAVYTGLIFSYFNAACSLFLLAPALSNGSSGIGVFIGIGIAVAVIVQAHRTITLAGKLKKARIPLTAKP
jgi:hypothetical protein